MVPLVGDQTFRFAFIFYVNPGKSGFPQMAPNFLYRKLPQD